ncbi:hypothetical protein ROZALSC1DRAFT_28538 [Rozella allomycis CSF55]|uniref:Uncharacterized protein n=1 Tax=Rozella allomycis (strain CSF55) TaxID=988480 RepID=A0A075AN82_ROZAC|nr:hypothetical protein O9G_006075 [Rozella allomycis CSF55]RKP19917.1 hypothetical protein ROZALSC1DRAFT_28538 [Rozella allomycis CSF55]|eukprot:EPZ31214.1 hypothetical protein O9G_006075 [Rozella allomycis CSF55]
MEFERNIEKEDSMDRINVELWDCNCDPALNSLWLTMCKNRADGILLFSQLPVLQDETILNTEFTTFLSKIIHQNA